MRGSPAAEKRVVVGRRMLSALPGDRREYCPVVAATRLSRGDRYERLPLSSGIFKSEVFPGLWLDPEALMHGDMARVAQVAQQGLAIPEHAGPKRNGFRRRQEKATAPLLRRLRFRIGSLTPEQLAGRERVVESGEVSRKLFPTATEVVKIAVIHGGQACRFTTGPASKPATFTTSTSVGWSKSVTP